MMKRIISFNDKSQREIRTDLMKILNHSFRIVYLEMQHYSEIMISVIGRVEMEVDKSYSEEFDWGEDH